jgi:hypothetical protein
VSTINLRSSDTDIPTSDVKQIFDSRVDPGMKPIQSEVIINYNGTKITGYITGMSIQQTQSYNDVNILGVRVAKVRGKVEQQAQFTMLITHINNSETPIVPPWLAVDPRNSDNSIGGLFG